MSRKLVTLILLVLISALSFLSYWDKYGTEKNEELIKSALVVYTGARATNAAVSLIQDMNINVSIKFLGGEFSPGELLDPLNDFIERFSAVMLFALTSLGIQSILIFLGSLMIIKVLVGLSVTVLITLLLLNVSAESLLGRISLKLLIVSLFIRFAVPTITIANQFIYQLFLHDHVTTAATFLSVDEIELHPESSLLEDTAEYYKFIKSQVNILLAKAESMTRYLINLLAIFIIQTILLPVLFIYICAHNGLKAYKHSSEFAMKMLT